MNHFRFADAKIRAKGSKDNGRQQTRHVRTPHSRRQLVLYVQESLINEMTASSSDFNDIVCKSAVRLC